MDDPNRPVTGYPAPNHNPQNGYPAGNPPPTGTAYPYAASGVPPANSYYTNPYYPPNYPPDPASVRRANTLRRFFAIVIGVVIAFGAITLIIWLVLRPKLPQFRVDSLSVSNFTLGGNSLISFTAQTHLTAGNPNKKMSLVYDRIEAGLFYESDSLSDTTVQPFSQGTRSETPLTANFAAAGTFVDKSVVDRLNRGRTSNGMVMLNLRMLTRVNFEAKAWKTRKRYMKVFCGPLSVAIPVNASSGTLTGGPRLCRVGI